MAVSVLLLIGLAGIGEAMGTDTPFDQEHEDRSAQIQKAIEAAQGSQNSAGEQAKTIVAAPEPPAFDDHRAHTEENDAVLSSQEGVSSQGAGAEAIAEESAETAGVAKEKETMGSDQVPEEKKQLVPEAASKPSAEESRLEYAALENLTWETREKKVTLQLWVSGKATPAVDVIRDKKGMVVRLRPKGLATQLTNTQSGVPSGVQSLTILEDAQSTQVWGLERPYYAIDEIQVVFALPVQYSVQQEPGLATITFLFPKKVKPKKPEPVQEPEAAMEVMQREALGAPETSRGASYQSQQQLEDRVLYGTQTPPSISDLYKRERANLEFRTVSGLPDNVRPIHDTAHPPFGSTEYFKKYVHGSLRQTFDFTTNYNQGVTNAFGELPASRAEPVRGKNIGTILGTPAVALLFYHPGVFDVSAGYSASRDFPLTNNNFFYGRDRQDIKLGLGHYSTKRYAFDAQSTLQLFDGTIRQKIGGKWLKAPSQSRQGYRLNNGAGLNYRLTNRLLWGGSAAMSQTRSETKTPGGRSRDVLGDLNTYFKYRLNSRWDFLLGTSFTHVFKDTAGNDSSALPGPGVVRTTKGNELESVYLSADYRYSKKITLRGGIQGSLIDWNIAKFGGSIRATYKWTSRDDLSFQFASNVVQDNTAKILARAVSIGGWSGITYQRVMSMGLWYNRFFDHKRTKLSLGVQYLRNGPLSGVFYGGKSGGTITNYDILFTASIRRAILKNKAWVGLLYSYEYAPNKIQATTTKPEDWTTNTSQNILATMDYAF